MSKKDNLGSALSTIIAEMVDRRVEEIIEQRVRTEVDKRLAEILSDLGAPIEPKKPSVPRKPKKAMKVIDGIAVSTIDLVTRTLQSDPGHEFSIEDIQEVLRTKYDTEYLNISHAIKIAQSKGCSIKTPRRGVYVYEAK